jgi:hypothetical protein
MITIREISDDKTTISSTRWAFALVIIFDIIIISAVIAASLIFHFLGKPLDNGFYGSVSLLLGIPTGLATGAKALQGWEPNKDKTENTDKE